MRKPHKHLWRSFLEGLESRILQTAILSSRAHASNAHVMAAAIAIPSLPPLPGDANSDGVVDFDDMTVVTGNWNHPGGVGDLNHDGIVNFNDMLMVTGNWGRTIYNGATMIVGGVLNVWQPMPVDAGTTWTGGSLYGASGPNVADIHQGQVNDCYLLAAIGALAIQRPQVIINAITTDATGYVVTWHDLNTGQAVLIHTSAQFSTALQIQGVPVWWEVLEKSFAEFRTWNGSMSQNSFNSIGFGFEANVWKELAGIVTQAISYANIPDSQVAMQITAELATHQLVTWDTNIAAGNGIVPNHVYIVVGAQTAPDGTVSLYLYQPWGFFQLQPLLLMEANGLGSWEVAT